MDSKLASAGFKSNLHLKGRRRMINLWIIKLSCELLDY